MRGHIITGVLLLAALLSGCVNEEQPPTTGADDYLLGSPDGVPAGQYQSHPAFGYPTNGMLPVAENGTTRSVAADGTVQWFLPAARALPSPITGLEAVTHAEGTSTGGGIAVFGPLAFIGERVEGPLQIVDISVPDKPQVVGEVDDVPVRDADTILYPDGRLVVITTAGGRTQFATDVTDPTAPVALTSIETAHGNHNIAVVPGTPLVYNSGSGGLIDIVDYSDPAAPVAVGTFFNGEGCHDITFFIDTTGDKQRAYCAGYAETQIWDIADPIHPQMVERIPYPTLEKGIPVVGDTMTEQDLPSAPVFPLSFSHLAMVNHDATVLIVGDETGGGLINGCDVYADAAGTTVSGPVGNLWFYDLSNESNPVLRGHVSPSAVDAADGSCTAHFGRLVEDTGLVAMGFYAAGVVLVDFNDLENPKIVHRLDQEGSIWDVQYHQGYLFTGDMSRGLDVLTFA